MEQQRPTHNRRRTKRAPDAGAVCAFQTYFNPFALSARTASPSPPQRRYPVKITRDKTQTVGRLNWELIVKTKRTFLIIGVLLAIISVVFLAILWIIYQPSDISRLDEEKEIYSTLLNSPYIGKNIVWAERTRLEDVDFSPEIIQYIENHLPNVDDSTITDFQSSNRQSAVIKDYLPTNNNYLFLSDADVRLFFNDWTTFSNKYPDIGGYISLSRIGFNSSYNQALVLRSSYVKLFNAPFEYGGDGLLFLFYRIGGKWVEQDMLVLSITG